MLIYNNYNKYMKFYTPRFKERNIHEKAMKATCNRLVENLSLNECVILLRKRKPPKSLLNNSEFTKVQILLEPGKSNNPEQAILRRILRKALFRRAREFKRFRVLSALHKISETLRYIPASLFEIDEAQMRHGKIVNVIKRRKKITNVGGVCHGVSSMAVIAILNNKLNEFDQTLQNIVDKNVVDADFLQGIEFLQDPSQHTEMLSGKGTPYQSVVQNYMLLPRKLVNDPIALVAAIAGNYNIKSLTKYFEQLRYALFTEKNLGPIALQLNNLNHSITVTFDFENQSWRLINASQSFLVSEDDIAKEILKAFGTTESQNLIVSTKIIANETNLEELRYKALHVQLWNLENMSTNINAAVTKADHLGNQLFAAAAKCGDLLAVKKLLVAHKLNPNMYPKALIRAAAAGNIEIMDLIIAHRGDVNLGSPMYYALYFNQTNAVKRLLDHPDIDLGKPVKMSRSLIVKLANERKIPKADMDSFLKKYFSRKMTAIVSLLDFAKLLGQDQNVALIEQKIQSKSSHAAKMFTTSLKKAAIQDLSFKNKTPKN